MWKLLEVLKKKLSLKKPDFDRKLLVGVKWEMTE